ncbi:uncharacterized protein LOC134712753 [Mytilus trossulus]|uniref:uncharacterized protein LOC134712753 n=1 Tax=Mytilus trossulus TaxID=6551 RepID=UPI003005974A
MNSDYNESNEKTYIPKQYRNNSSYKVGIIISCLIFCCTLIAICVSISTIHRNKVQNGELDKTQENAYHILMSSHVIEDTEDVLNGQRKVTYIMVSTTESIVIFITLISGQHTLLPESETTNNSNSYTGKERLKDLEVFKLVKEEYSASSTDQNTQQTTNPLLRAQGNKVSTGVIIPHGGHYYLYACLQLTWYKMSTRDSEVTHFVQLHSANITHNITERTIQVPQRSGMYSTSRIFLPIKLKKNDVISMHASDSSYVYNSQKSNIIGVFRASVDHYV